MDPEVIFRGVIGAVVFGLGTLLFFFVWLFLLPSWRLRSNLARIIKEITALKEQGRQILNIDIIQNQIMNVEPFKHLWKEYAGTLHRQFDVVDGKEKLVQLRETATAELFFSPEALVDITLKTDFFKHLPGIFTGIGIIGTFFGLIVGLSNYLDSGLSPEERLKGLVLHVYIAFMVSAGAITIAIAVTILEKIAITFHYKQVEDLCRLIDSMYVSGVGEEYLLRLVKASEESATQTTQLKDSLVSDLRELMINQADRQIQATQASHQAMAASISASITEGLHEPMERISQVVDRTTESQGSAVQRVLADVLTAFMERLENVFGGQINGLNTLMQETATSMRDTRDRFAELVRDLSGAGRNAGEAMGEQLTQALEAAEHRQQEMNNQMRQFVEQIRELVSRSQTETSETLTQTVETLNRNVVRVIDNLSEQQSRAGEEASRRQEAMADHAQGVVSGLNNNINALVAQTSEAVQAMRESISAIRNITAESVERMESGAKTLYLAAIEFSQAGQGVTGVFAQATQVSERLIVVSTSLNAAARTVELAVASYDNTRSDLASMMESLQTIIESAKREAGVSRELVSQLESAAEKFNVVQRDTEAYLEKVSGVLAETFARFTENMVRSLDTSHAEFHKKLAEAVGMLRGTIEDLDDFLGRRSPGAT